MFEGNGVAESTDLIVFSLVLGLRLFSPLLIPRQPLPGVVLCLFIDWIDGDIFRRLTDLPLDFYQSYDKALDIYYHAIAYLATLRNWSHLFAFQLGRFLFYYRLVGVLLFNLSGIRALLLVFTNAFEFFFIFYEGVRVRWNPLRLSRKALLVGLAVIVIFIKIPQNFVIHIAKISAADWLKIHLFGVAPDVSPLDALAASPGVTLALVVAAALVLAGLWWIVTRKLRPADWSPRFAADPLPPAPPGGRGRPVAPTSSRPFFGGALLEKTVLVSLLVVIFAQTLPGLEASPAELAFGVTVVIAINAVVSQWLARRGTSFASMWREFVVMAAINFGVVLLYAILLPWAGGDLPLGMAEFFVLLLTLIVVYHDNYRPVFERRFAGGRQHGAAWPGGLDG